MCRIDLKIGLAKDKARNEPTTRLLRERGGTGEARNLREGQRGDPSFQIR